MAKRLQIIGDFPSNGTVDPSEIEKMVDEHIQKEETLSGIATEAAKLVTIDEVDPDKVIFPDGLTTTYAIGKVTLTNGMGTLVEPGGTLTDFFNNFVDEKNPTTVQPSVSLTFNQGGIHEVGTKLTPTYSATLNPGSYTYGPSTGVVATEWEVTDSAGNTSTNPSGTFDDVYVTDDLSYTITAKATHTAGTMPVTNTGNEYPSGQIAAGTKSASASAAITGYRNSFYGTLAEKGDLTSDDIRGLTNKTDKAIANGAVLSIAVPVGAMRVIFAYPATLRDVTSVKDVNGLGAEIGSSFAKQILAVEGANSYSAIDYKVYTLDFAKANNAANTFTVTI